MGSGGVCPVLQYFVQYLKWIVDERTKLQLVWPHLAGSRCTWEEGKIRRAYRLKDWEVRTVLPLAKRRSGGGAHRLILLPITDMASAKAARVSTADINRIQMEPEAEATFAVDSALYVHTKGHICSDAYSFWTATKLPEL